MKTASSRLGGRQKIKWNLSKTNTLLICIGLLRFLSSWSPALKTQEFPLITQQLFHFQLQFFYHSSLTELYLKSSLCESRKISWAVFYLSANTHMKVVPTAAFLPASWLNCFQRQALSSTDRKKISHSLTHTSCSGKFTPSSSRAENKQL